MNAASLERLKQADAIYRRLVEDDQHLLSEDALGEHTDDPEVAALVRRLYAQSTGDDDAKVPTMIGGHRLERLLGHGGSSSVYLATQDLDGAARRVAIKVLHGQLRNDLVARVQRERRALARLNHPNIASVHDVGVDADDAARPASYLVMEYVEGASLIEWIAGPHDAQARARLFLPLAEAVAHAHQRLILHRDIKPSNVVVTRDGTPKLLDFGIAKLLDEAGVGHDTEAGLPLPITLPFASPELVLGEPAQVASDVYQLGALLYVMLAGRPPFDSASRRKLCADITSGQYTRLRHLPEPRPRVATDLEAIVDKAMAVDPSERYNSASDLAADVRAYLEGRPVRARRGSAFYVARKLVARNRFATALSAAFVLSLAAATGMLWQQNRRLDEARREARDEAASANAVLDFMEGIFRQAAPEVARGEVYTVKDAVKRAASALPGPFADRKRTHARVLSTIGRIEEDLGDLPAALAHYEHAAALAGELGRGEMEAARNLGRVLFRLGDYAAAEKQFEAILAREATTPSEGEARLAALGNMAGIYAARDDDRAVPAARAHVEERIARQGERAPETLQAINNYASMVGRSSQVTEDERRAMMLLMEKTRAAAQEVLGRRHPLGLSYETNYLVLRGRLGHRDEVMAPLEGNCAAAETVLGASHVIAMTCRYHLAFFEIEGGRVDDAFAHLDAMLARATAALGPRHPMFWEWQLRVIQELQEHGRDDAARKILESAGEPPMLSQRMLDNYAGVMQRAGLDRAAR
jgi:tetratricopeptide (TPR) repeat protein/predicted Ser/Thr protein kinase